MKNNRADVTRLIGSAIHAEAEANGLGATGLPESQAPSRWRASNTSRSRDGVGGEAN
jgi:hypothetical protein